MSWRTAKAMADRAAYLQSLIHRDAESYRQDQRPGAMHIGADGSVLARRIELPPDLAAWQSIGARSLLPSDAPSGHPRASENREISGRAILRDLLADPLSPPRGYREI